VKKYRLSLIPLPARRLFGPGFYSGISVCREKQE
jgi:hypothetical protein